MRVKNYEARFSFCYIAFRAYNFTGVNPFLCKIPEIPYTFTTPEPSNSSICINRISSVYIIIDANLISYRNN